MWRLRQGCSCCLVPCWLPWTVILWAAGGTRAHEHPCSCCSDAVAVSCGLKWTGGSANGAGGLGHCLLGRALLGLLAAVAAAAAVELLGP